MNDSTKVELNFSDGMRMKTQQKEGKKKREHNTTTLTYRFPEIGDSCTRLMEVIIYIEGKFQP